MAHDVKHTTSSVKRGGGSVMSWTRMAVNGTGSVVFIEDVTADRSHDAMQKSQCNTIREHLLPLHVMFGPSASSDMNQSA